MRNVIILLILLIALLTLKRYLRRKKFLDFFKDMGFGDVLLSKFSTNELADSYSYINNFSRKNIELTILNNPDFYKRVKAINDKFHIFTNLK